MYNAGPLHQRNEFLYSTLKCIFSLVTKSLLFCSKLLNSYTILNKGSLQLVTSPLSRISWRSSLHWTAYYDWLVDLPQLLVRVVFLHQADHYLGLVKQVGITGRQELVYINFYKL